jgi:hypothetical protein
VRLGLELNAESVSTAVRVFIERKVSRLAQQKRYDKRTKDAIQEHLALNANDTFLWVALVCQTLETAPEWNVLKKLDMFPPGLDSLYEGMMQQISKSEDDAEPCKQVLALITLVYRPLTWQELAAFVKDTANDSVNAGDHWPMRLIPYPTRRDCLLCASISQGLSPHPGS